MKTNTFRKHLFLFFLIGCFILTCIAIAFSTECAYAMEPDEFVLEDKAKSDDFFIKEKS